MSAGLHFEVDLEPPIELRLEEARTLYRECTNNLDSRDYSWWAAARQRADVILFPDARAEASMAGPLPLRFTAFQLFEFLGQHGGRVEG